MLKRRSLSARDRGKLEFALDRSCQSRPRRRDPLLDDVLEATAQEVSVTPSILYQWQRPAAPKAAEVSESLDFAGHLFKARNRSLPSGSHIADLQSPTSSEKDVPGWPAGCGKAARQPRYHHRSGGIDMSEGIRLAGAGDRRRRVSFANPDSIMASVAAARRFITGDDQLSPSSHPYFLIRALVTRARLWPTNRHLWVCGRCRDVSGGVSHR